MVRLVAVGKRFGRGPWVLSGVTLSLPAGEVTAVRGTNGAGKSTLLRVVAGISPPTTGRVLDRPRRVAYVPEQFPAQGGMSGHAYLRHMARLRGLGASRAARRVEWLWERFGVRGDPDGPLRALSKGNRQKVALAQAFLVPPELLVLDEPWSGLDAAAHGVLAEVVAEARQEGAAVVVTDHTNALAPSAIDAVVRVTDGQAVREDPPSPSPTENPAAVPAVSTAPTAPAVSVRLRRTGRESGTWESWPGAVPWEEGADATDGDAAPDPDLVRLRVSREHTDTLLAEALRRGWSVHEVASLPENDGGQP
ncbi:ABC-type multidrug transport system, ATPase component [Streptoalloteichus tenebrarius]|uniref:ABC-type multidrug transport system, ATPase component n=1 Tax=Streptoalloteichus tenebrarius (strain ATCC 17920 / DSM 40477 / JCM 4838 / CBS 697.72 / NBRC 16177 / NCIMB 11028 / NRRL B-12390 / A12253. 1 / ISP 5477) TaxID=1933 RepID=A0ABT1HQQ7_STRSD|nr:ABC transporter ATP-binding protein [Streptoalloteichus tenebrarius]MCP2257833.1 ABC-type multidrug transport system, ATPase component [Streptoalloteichus tenebrarius]BFE99805.1 ABC transporter ATP-binding protein [Streptoalloteichus tenebrarius]